MKLSNEYINKQYLANVLANVHPEDRNWKEAIGIIEGCGATEAYPINWIDTSFLNYNINDICEKPYVVALPIKVGDKVYVDPFLSKDLKIDNYLRKGEITSITLGKSSIIFSVRLDNSETENDLPTTLYFSSNEINKKVFLEKNYRG